MRDKGGSKNVRNLRDVIYGWRHGECSGGENGKNVVEGNRGEEGRGC